MIGNKDGGLVGEPSSKRLLRHNCHRESGTGQVFLSTAVIRTTYFIIDETGDL